MKKTIINLLFVFFIFSCKLDNLASLIGIDNENLNNKDLSYKDLKELKNNSNNLKEINNNQENNELKFIKVDKLELDIKTSSYTLFNHVSRDFVYHYDDKYKEHLLIEKIKDIDGIDKEYIDEIVFCMTSVVDNKKLSRTLFAIKNKEIDEFKKAIFDKDNKLYYDFVDNTIYEIKTEMKIFHDKRIKDHVFIDLPYINYSLAIPLNEIKKIL